MKLGAKLRSQQIMRTSACSGPREQFPLPARLFPHGSALHAKLNATPDAKLNQ
jgi:hypothetical protein